MEHRARATFLDDAYVKQALVRRLARIVVNDTSILIDREHLVRFQLTLIDTTRTHRQSERLTLDHRTQIPTRPQQPPPRIKPIRDHRHPRRKLREVVRHARRMLESGFSRKYYQPTKSTNRTSCDLVPFYGRTRYPFTLAKNVLAHTR